MLAGTVPPLGECVQRNDIVPFKSLSSDYVNIAQESASYIRLCMALWPQVGFLEWTDPLFIGGHWTPQIIEMAGGEHPLNPCK